MITAPTVAVSTNATEGMKITCAQEDLNWAVSTVKHAVDSQHALPILSNLVLQTDHGRLRVYATNLRHGISCWIDADIELEGETALPARAFADHVSALNGLVDISVGIHNKTHKVKVKSVGSNTNIVGFDVTEYPPVANYRGEAASAILTAKTLKEVVALVGFAAARPGDPRPILTAVRVKFDLLNGVSFAAADAFRLAVCDVALTDAESNTLQDEVLIPASSLIELAKILPDEGVVQMILTPNQSQVLFHSENVDLTSRLLEGTYLPVQNVLYDDKDFVSVACMQTLELKNALKRVIPFGNRDQANDTRLYVSGDQESGLLELVGATADVGDNISTVNAKVRGPKRDVSLDARYLFDMLAALDSGEYPTVSIKLILSNPSPITVTADGLSGYTYVVMPKSDPKSD